MTKSWRMRGSKIERAHLPGQGGCCAEPEVDTKEFFKQEWSHCDFSNGVAGMRDDAGWDVEPVVAEAANRFFLPLSSEVMAFQELNESEGKDPDGKVEAVGGELSARHVIKAVVGFELSDHFLELAAAIMEVNNRLRIFFLLRDIGSN